MAECLSEELDGLQARCLRNMLRIPASFVSRVSNKKVLERAGQKPFTTQLVRHQLLLLGRIARAPDSDLRRRLTFCRGTLWPATNLFVRRVGRPRHEWAPKLLQIVYSTWGHRAEQLMRNEGIWRVEVHKQS